MSKYEDALYTLLDIISRYQVEKYIISNKEIEDATDSLEELINRDKALQVDDETEHIEVYASTYYNCPKCNKEIQIHTNYCPYCGQKLDWGNENQEVKNENNIDYRSYIIQFKHIRDFNITKV